MNIRPSSAHRWVNCYGSAALEALFPDNVGTEAIEGTTAHEAAEQVLKGVVKSAQDLIGKQMSTGLAVTDEMALHVGYYVGVVMDKVQELGIEDTLVIEDKLHISYINHDLWGTPDAWAFDRSTGTIYLWDLKYGYGIVDVIDNPQFGCYVVGIWEQLNKLGQTVKHIVATAVQPRPWHPEGDVRTWNISTDEFRPQIEILGAAAQAALTPGAPTATGSHCRYCRALHDCPSSREASYAAMDIVGTSQPDSVNPVVIGSEITLLRRAKEAVVMRLEAMEALGQSIAEKGGVIPGYKMGHGRGTVVYTQPEEIMITLGRSVGVQMTKTTLISPNQAKLSGVPKVVLETMTKTLRGKPKLVAGDAAEEARRFFNGK